MRLESFSRTFQPVEGRREYETPAPRRFNPKPTLWNTTKLRNTQNTTQLHSSRTQNTPHTAQGNFWRPSLTTAAAWQPEVCSSSFLRVAIATPTDCNLQTVQSSLALPFLLQRAQRQSERRHPPRPAKPQAAAESTPLFLPASPCSLRKRWPWSSPQPGQPPPCSSRATPYLRMLRGSSGRSNDMRIFNPLLQQGHHRGSQD
ncbi:uncharacterized protein [Salvelinus alpinus]|uniref:uncharacterized protein n=1 Tax=Salvelinus alpinus TaxID=8036 RepID=UPI0039FD2DCF